jgi:methionyl-tRNA formyltransferase
MKLTQTPVKLLAEDLGLSVETPLKCRSKDFIASLAERDADLFVVAAYGQILPQTLLDVPRHGCFNLHGSLLPRWRGAAPIHRALEAGDQVTGVTLMKMDAGMDTGDMVAKGALEIFPTETRQGLEERLAELGAKMILDWRERLIAPGLVVEKQDDSLATLANKVTSADGILSWQDSAERNLNRIRAFTPFCRIKTRFSTPADPALKVLAARLGEGDGQPGEILSVRPDLTVAFGSGSLVFQEVQPAGRKKMSGADYGSGARLLPGEFLSPLSGQTEEDLSL